MFLFFILQAVGIVLEDVVCSFFKVLWQEVEADDKTGKSAEVMEWVGRIWVFAWLWCTGQFVVECWLKTEQGLLITRSLFSN